MVKFIVSNQIELQTGELPALIEKRLISDLTLENPVYIQALKYGHSIHDKPKHLKLYRYEGDTLVLPRGVGGRLVKYLQDSKVKYQLIDRRLKLQPVEFHSSINLRGYQETAVSKVVQWRQGGICAPCGAGKTMIMLEAMARIGQPTLFIVHTKELLDQIIDRACSVIDLDRDEIGIIGDGSFTIGGRMTVALIQTLSKADLSDITNKFGAIFVDEAHHLAAKSFFYPISMFPALYRIWVSATPERSDGLTKMVYAAGGPIVHTINQNEVPTMIPELRVIETDYDGMDEEYTYLMSDLINDKDRNDLIVQTISSEANGNYSLVLSDRVEHLEILKPMLQRQLPHLTIEFLTGSMKKKERSDVMERVKNKEVDILLATQLAREGLDITHLNRLYLATPKKAGGAVQQEVGRVMRPCEGKTEAIVYDFWDNKSPMLKPQFWKRREIYKKIGMDWQPSKTKAVSFR
ncbi:DEAD/DEAH box helicase [Ammoniphilus resinae]|uniref:Superfamily II DNA or RNA helicase n=1 Tax=Ammoniphilus resinae TaxID=861532 RepID=A0ABS4GXR3_9BACL|nr:DEAD/DEAH box helicase [Ammoniphilus resinae]MBP1934887.1 superfamily II DNA or RNA helicase [Ammoniphilus resinae]